MKVLLGMALAVLVGSSVFGAGLPAVTINGKEYTNVNDVHLTSENRIMILFPGGGISPNADTIPTDFLESWNIGKETLEKIKSSEAIKAEKNLQSAIASGCFREVGGVVYDTRKPQSGWVIFYNARVLQITDHGAIVLSTPDVLTATPLRVENLPAGTSDTDIINFSAKMTGSYSYINKRGDDRTIRAYDVGRACAREEIPDSVLTGKKAFAALPIVGAPRVDVIASLPESDDLKASGSGFFITEDGYLITNDHVVRGATKIKVKTPDGIFPAVVVRVDETNDLALVKVSGQFKPLCISTNDAQLGDSVFTIGFPAIDLQGAEPKYTDGRISSLSGLRDDPTEYQVSVQVQPGNSGGPLVDMSGNVKGVIVARLNDFAALRSMGSLPQNVNYAVKGKLLRDFLGQSSEVKWTPGQSPVDGKTAIPSVQRAVAIVLVY
jgi:hypothetical protein